MALPTILDKPFHESLLRGCSKLIAAHVQAPATICCSRCPLIDFSLDVPWQSPCVRLFLIASERILVQ
jgi:hypothetical protein